MIDSPKKLSVNPLRVSQRVGSVLALLGLSGSLPLEHGPRGCTAFSKLFFMRHFREPIPLQTTAVDEVTTVLGADANLLQALETVIDTNHPEIVGVVGTTLSDFQGADLRYTVEEYRRRRPDHAPVVILPVDSEHEAAGQDSLEIGFARTVESLINALVPTRRSSVERTNQVNVLASSVLTPGDIDALKDWITAFGLQPVVVPDLGDSLDGHLIPSGFSPLTYGGVTCAEIQELGRALATIVVGPSLRQAARLLHEKTGVPSHDFATLMGLEACDALTSLLRSLSGREIPARILRQRAQLLDAMVDCQFYTAGRSALVAGDPDLLVALHHFLTSVGVEVPAMITTWKAPSLKDVLAPRILVGDLDDFEQEARSLLPNLLVTNSHGAPIAHRLGAPLLRAGYPQYDFIGAHARTWIGYTGSRQVLFDIANLLADGHRTLKPYRSIYRSSSDPAARIRSTPAPADTGDGRAA